MLLLLNIADQRFEVVVEVVEEVDEGATSTCDWTEVLATGGDGWTTGGRSWGATWKKNGRLDIEDIHPSY